MKGLAILLALLGAASALQNQLEYRYHYNGTVATGIPELHGQYAGARMSADIILQVISESKIIAKLENVLVGDFNGHVDCNERSSLPIHAHPLWMRRRLTEIEKPFLVRLKAVHGNVMEVQDEEEMWITNIRKAIINLFRIIPFTGPLPSTVSNILESKHMNFPQFKETEMTLFGECDSMYTITDIPLAIQAGTNITLFHSFEQDVQNDKRSSGNYRTSSRHDEFPHYLGSNLTRVVRSINFDHCSDLVAFQHSDVLAKNCSMAGGQCHNLKSRSSRGEYLIRGEDNMHRIEKAIVEGAVIIAPYGYKSEYVQALTNQTLTLAAVKMLEKKIELPGKMKEIRTWKFEVASPYQASPYTHYDWVRFKHDSVGENAPFSPELVTIGKEMTHEMIELVKKNVSLIMKEIVNELMAVDSSNVQSRNVSYQLYTVSRLINFLPLTDLRALYEQVMGSEEVLERKQILQSFFVDAMASSGSGPAVQVLLEKMESGAIPAARIASIFATLSNNMVAPAVLDKLVEYAMSLDIDEHPELTSTVLVNTGTLIHNLCVEPQRMIRSIPTPILGKGVCNSLNLADKFILYLNNMLKSKTLSWQKVIYVKALSTVGAPKCVPILMSIASNSAKYDAAIRVNAIYGLSRYNLASSFTNKNEVMRSLMSIYETWSELPEVRQACVAVMFSWSPSTEWWKKLALSTWREPSRQVASFITSAMESVAHGEPDLYGNKSIIASHVLPLAKPVPFSLRYSKNYILSTLMYPIRYAEFTDVAWLSNTKSLFPREIYLHIHKNLGGYPTTLIEFAMQDDGIQKYIDKFLNVWEERKPTGERYGKVDPAVQEKAKSVIAGIGEELLTETRRRNETEMVMYLRLLELMKVFVSTNKERIDQFDMEKFIEGMKEGHDFYVSKFVKPYDLIEFLPTELGVPLLLVTSMPSFTLYKGFLKLKLPNDEHVSNLDELLLIKQANLTVRANITAQATSTTMFRVPIPWSNKTIGAGVTNDMYFNLPHKVEYIMNNTITSFNLTVKYKPSKNHKTDFLHASNMPFTIREPLQPVDASAKKDLKTIRTRNPVDQFNVTIPLLRDITGMNVTLDWHADIDFMHTFAYFYRTIINMHYGAKFNHPWKMPSTKFWNLTAIYDPLTSDNKYFIGQIAYGKNITTNVTSVNHMTKELSVERILRELKERRSSGNSLNTTSFVAMAEFVGAQTRKYAFYGSATGYFVSPKRTFTEIVATLSRTPIPGKENLPNNMCWRAEVTKPKFSDLETLHDVLSMNFMTDIKFKTYLDSNCQSSVIAKGEGHLDMSEERKTRINEALYNLCDILDFDRALTFLRHSVYDKAQAEMSWTKDVPKGVMNVTRKIEDFLFATYYPNLDINYNEHNEPEKIDFHGHRPINTNKWELSILNPRARINAHKLSMNPIIDTMMPMGGRTEYHHHIYEKFTTGETTKCIVSTDVIRTFDGVEIIPEFPNRCWKVAAEDCSSSKDWIVETREVTSGQPEARVYAVKDALEVIMKPGHVEVNGKVIQPVNGTQRFYDSAGTFYYLVAKDGEKVLFYLPGRVEVVINKAVQIKVSVMFAGITCGVCGDRNTEAFADMTGPKFCIYNETSMYEAAWTLINDRPDKCDQKEVIELKEQIIKYQQNCPKFNGTIYRDSSRTQRKIALQDHNECLGYYYAIHEMGTEICVSKNSMPNCKPICTGQGKHIHRTAFACYPKEKVEPYVQEQIIPGFIEHQVPLHGGMSREFDVYTPEKCIHS